MKRILSLTLVIMLVFVLGAFVAYADDAPVVDGAGEGQIIVVEDNSRFDKLLENLASSTVWTTIGTVLAAVVGTLAMIKKHFGNISTLISGKADTKAVNAALKDASKEISDEFCKKLDELEAKLTEADNDEKKLMAMFTIFATNANINPNAKAEIMNYLTGIKDIGGKVVDVVEAANKIIAEANAAEVKVETPALDAIVSESVEGGMLLD